MSSYRFDRERKLRQEELTRPSQNAYSSRIPGISNIGHSGSAITKSQVPRPSVSSRARRGSSISESEDPFRGRIPTPQTAKAPLKEIDQSSGIPQPSKIGPGLAHNLIPSGNKMGSPIQSQPKPVLGSPASFGNPILTEGRSRNVLRRKAPSIEQYAERSRARLDTSKFGLYGSNTSLSKAEDNEGKFGTDPYSEEGPRKDVRSQTQKQVQVPPSQSDPLPSKSQMRSKIGDTNIPQIPREVPRELAGLANTVNTTNLPPPTPNFASTSSPSTRYSESPGVWSSRTSTPTSMSSYSPGIIPPTKIGSRLRQPSPNLSRSPLPRQATAPLPSTTTPINKGATGFYPKKPVKSQTHPPITTVNAEKIERNVEEDARKVTIPPHSPPPRKSSTKFKSPRKKEDDNVQKSGNDSRTGERKGSIEPCQSKIESVSRLPAPTSTLPPSRPSRAGTSDLDLKPSPIIQSNMASLKYPGHKRQASSDSTHRKIRPTHNINSSTESFQSKSSSRIPNRYASPYPAGSQNSSTSKLATASKDSLSRTKTVLTKDPKEPKETTTPGGTRRFGIFSRKGKVDTEVAGSDRKDKPARRGPAAGTGHEGYGRYAQRGRRSSVSSVNGRASSTSAATSSRKGSDASRAYSEMDDFLLNRLEPVIISGGGMDGAELSRTQSEQSASSVSVASMAESRPGLYISKNVSDSCDSLASGTGPATQPAETFDSLLQRMRQNEEKPEKPGLAHRRSFRKSQIFGTNKDVALPLSVNTDIPKSRPSIDSGNTSHTSFSQSSVSMTATDRALDKKVTKQPEKKGRWNFFQRSHQTSRKGSTPEPTSAVEVPVSISKVPAARQVAHYALLENEHIDSDSLEGIFHRIEESPPTEEDEEHGEEVPLGLGLKRQHGHSVLLPSPPLLAGYTFEQPVSSPSPKVFFNKNIFSEKPKSNADPKTELEQDRRANRLTSVGRIPQVVSSREEQANPPIPSFSRPFSRVEIPSLTTTANQQASQFYNPGRSPVGSQTEVLASREFHPGSAISDPAVQLPSGSNPIYTRKDGEFLTFPRRKSVTSGSSSSEGPVSLTAMTAVEPPPGSKLNEDEVWNEYDDLIETALSPKTPQRKRRSNSSQQSFKLAARASRTLQVELDGLGNDKRFISSPSEHSSLHRSMSSSFRSSGSSVRLRRSMILSALHASMTQTSPMSFNDTGHSNKNSTELINQCSALSVRQPDSKFDTITESPLPTPRNNEADRRRNTFLLDKAEQDRNGTVEQTNIRSGSLMTSRWLSFGRVLFSPAHNHLRDEDQGRVLVIDGLGNDDWSFYCALTYPAAIIYSLGFSSPSTVSSNPAAWKPPTNHRTIHHANIESPFPFPKGFFTAAVLRFPAACSESGLRNTVSECKRVLRPGAYLELNVMDLDMVNMGNRTRKAVRMLKERICMADQSISLKPASDNIQTLLGKRGFENLNRCMVGVPVAGTIQRSSDTSSSSRSTATLPTPTNPYTVDSASSVKDNGRSRRPPSDDPNLSLGDLLSDKAPSESNDESITKMVAKVARWWYTRCYEAAILPNGNPDYSIWADRRVLRECQRRGTGFRLLIAYAQKPSEPRRTASV
ncbi:hypothetical protein AJ79_00784 [Helicocarpus griseus UAMH5409]|uniref:Methyltransferase type 11 domain-containing protein n=1 Tax=Helicocarpus griseus UAMH5409 TaxID=1447875 RepID=A0A2B7Y9F1_9EURO|nr:hypothetical protein AJ79_00784 [Helicocarpus griseus UAMH5409]